MNTLRKFSLKRNIAIACLLFINFIFFLKYLSRVTDFAWLIALGSLPLYWLLVTNKFHLNFSQQVYKYSQFALITLFVIGASIVFAKIDVQTLNVDRWSVISSFLDAALRGEYPYLAKSHMGSVPGPMPFYYVLALPFYLINELGYFSLVGLLILYYLFSKLNITNNYKLLILIFLMVSPFYLWEVTVRSNIFTTSVLIVLLLNGFLQRKSNTDFSFYVYAIVAGLLLSTRAVFSIPYIIFFMYGLLKKETTILEMSKFVIVAMLAFAATFLPLLISFPKEFFEMNPFIVQSTFLVPFYYTIVFIILAFIFSFLAKSKNDLFYWSGLCLFLIILVFIGYHLSIGGWQEFFTGKRADISYFIFCIPFFIKYLLISNQIKCQLPDGADL